MLSDTMMLGGGRTAAYPIQNSLLFRGGQYLSRTPSVAGNRQKFTISAWVRRAQLGTVQSIFGVYDNATYTDSGLFNLYFDAGDAIGISGGATWWRQTTARYRDTTAWLHVVCSVDTTSQTLSLYVNGQPITSFSVNNPIAANLQTAVNGTEQHRWGSINQSSAYYWTESYLAEPILVDGAALTAASFGEVDAVTGSWRPKAISGITWGTNGCYLGKPWNAASLGADYSGQGNTWTSSGFVASDVVSDTPANVFATLNPLNASPQTALSNGNLSLAPYGANKQNYSTFPIPSSGKWVFETSTTVNNTGGGVGVTVRGADVMNSGASGPFYIYLSTSGNKYSPGPTHSSYGGSWDAYSDIAACVIDRDAGTIEFFKNGVSQGVAFTGVSSSLELYAWIGANNDPSAVRTINFGQRTFAYPNAYGAAKPLCTANLPVPAIRQPKKHMGVVAYTGNGGTKTVTGVGFQPDFVWMKCRNAVSSHQLFDSVRGAGNRLYSDLTNAEDYLASSLISFDADGFTLGNFGQNASGNAYVAWCWKAGNTAVANTAGTIASQVSANPAAGFSIISYVGTAANATVGHGLASSPAFIIFKNRSAGGSAAYNWAVYHKSVGATGALWLNDTATVTTHTSFFNNTEPSSAVITVSSSTQVNAADNNIIAYCWSEVPGFSKFGSYTGNGSADGPFVHCGFRPRWVIVKRVDAAGEWYMLDTARDPANPVDNRLSANSAAAEFADDGFNSLGLDYLADGFEVRTDGWGNVASATYIYAAFAEYPLGGGKVTPAKAR
jgi:hypothetical protein